MEKNNLSGFFESFLTKESIFLNKKAIQSSFVPETIRHREEQIKQITSILAPIVRIERPSNIFIYGKTGSGKTLAVRFVAEELKKTIENKELPIIILYINCKLKKAADTEYRIMAQLTRGLGKEVPMTGLPTQEVYNLFFDSIDTTERVVLIILDEIDQLVKRASGNELLYSITRANDQHQLKKAQLSVIGISNDMMFAENLEPRVKSSLSEEEILFPPYNALQLIDILDERAKVAFKKDVLSEGVIKKCAAHAARDHGDARRALELLRVAGELAERAGQTQVQLEHVDQAEEKTERDRIAEIITTQPKQMQATLYSLLIVNLASTIPNNTNNTSHKDDKGQFTGDVYKTYLEICRRVGLRPLTQRRISDIITELDMLGLISATVISKGRYGKTRKIDLTVPHEAKPKIKKMLEQALNL